MSNKFHRNERLKSRKEIGRLFGKSGRSLSSYPLRLVYAEAEEVRGTFPYQVAFVVPKRRFKKAVDRNLIKRRVQEAYRLQKRLIGAHTQVQGNTPRKQWAPPAKQLALMFIYTGKEAMPQAYIERKMKKLLGQLAERESLT
ncbi:ribonuclease P protein component [Neolewinella agarilytica]|uniref:Ribonuclease P protein component n=1 Tax=Neolewinella agarilytica TaxID=478744 RepID=A0A1H9F652_9BACT|nr:ribonuclease P protein component [Neolewinella agarilytica]SEQ33466.1 ribonuclease P protein component [Neolewinella agarilytica]